MAGLIERLKRWLEEPKAEFEPKTPSMPIFPSGSPLADKIRQMSDQIGVARAEETKRKKEEERRQAELKKTATEKTARELKEIFSKLGVIEILQDLQKNVWRGGDITGPVVNAQPDGGEIAARLEFHYPTATSGYSSADFGDDWGYAPKIYMETEYLMVSVHLNRKRDVVERELVVHPRNERIKLNSEINYEATINQLQKIVSEDSVVRIVDEGLPVAKLVARGKEMIREVKARFKGEVQDKRK